MAVATAYLQERETAFTERQASVLEVGLKLLVDGGDKGLTTAGLAKAAGCSKESLYKWFGDRDGILEAIVSYQASKVRGVDERATPASKEAFEAALTAFAEDLLNVLMSETSLALNRLAIGSVKGGSADLGPLLLEKGKRRIEARAVHLLTHGRRQRFIAYDDAGKAYNLLYGLVVGDMHIRALLGDLEKPDNGQVRTKAVEAIQQFLTLHAPALS
ncbi:MAG: TetR/AcrR family transcriptional regulator [Pseudomonadota bacterium]